MGSNHRANLVRHDRWSISSGLSAWRPRGATLRKTEKTDRNYNNSNYVLL